VVWGGARLGIVSLVGEDKDAMLGEGLKASRLLQREGHEVKVVGISQDSLVFLK